LMLLETAGAGLSEIDRLPAEEPLPPSSAYGGAPSV
jgi:hypothetical protein